MYNKEIEEKVEQETKRFGELFLSGEFKKYKSDNHGPNYRITMLSEDESNFLDFLNSDLARKIVGK